MNNYGLYTYIVFYIQFYIQFSTKTRKKYRIRHLTNDEIRKQYGVQRTSQNDILIN